MNKPLHDPRPFNKSLIGKNKLDTKLHLALHKFIIYMYA